jgi:hypothetical protein
MDITVAIIRGVCIGILSIALAVAIEYYRR